MKKVIINHTGIAEPHVCVGRKSFVMITEPFRGLGERIGEMDNHKDSRVISFVSNRNKFFRRVGLFEQFKSNNNNMFHQRSCLAIGLTDGVV